MTVISTFEELVENKEFQEALGHVLPRLSAYLGFELLKVASNNSMSAEDKGSYLEAHADIIYLMTNLYQGKGLSMPEVKQAHRERPRLRNSQFHQ